METDVYLTPKAIRKLMKCCHTHSLINTNSGQFEHLEPTIVDTSHRSLDKIQFWTLLRTSICWSMEFGLDVKEPNIVYCFSRCRVNGMLTFLWMTDTRIITWLRKFRWFQVICKWHIFGKVQLIYWTKWSVTKVVYRCARKYSLQGRSLRLILSLVLLCPKKLDKILRKSDFEANFYHIMVKIYSITCNVGWFRLLWNCLSGCELQ